MQSLLSKPNGTAMNNSRQDILQLKIRSPRLSSKHYITKRINKVLNTMHSAIIQVVSLIELDDTALENGRDAETR